MLRIRTGEVMMEMRSANVGRPGRGLVIAAAAMLILGQVLAIANDVVLRQSDPSDIGLLVVLLILTVFMLRRARWARWATVALVTLGGLAELAGVALLVASNASAGFWASFTAAMPVVAASLHQGVAAFTASPLYPLLVASVLVSALLDLTAAGILAFAPGVRAYFARPVAAG